jgi:hypothetical protein
VAGVRLGALVDVDALVVLRLESGLAVADGQVVLGPAGSLSTGDSSTRIDALKVLGVTGSIPGTFFIRLALNPVAANVGVRGVASVTSWAGAVGLVLDGLAGGLLGAEGKAARILASLASS